MGGVGGGLGDDRGVLGELPSLLLGLPQALPIQIIVQPQLVIIRDSPLLEVPWLY